MRKKLKVAFIGMSHLSLNYMAAASEKNVVTTGFDPNQNLIKKLKNGDINLDEPHLKNILKKNRSKISFSSDLKKLRNYEIIYIANDIQTNDLGKSNFKDLIKLINLSKKFIGKTSTFVILSQIPPGFMRKIKFDKSRLFYQVETLIFGQAIKRAVHPERIIVGCFDENKRIKKNYLNFINKFNCPIIPMKYESAELTKVAINLFLASSITTTNTLAKVCEKISADWQEIVPALRLDKRIGKNAYLAPGLGISGGNIERDIYVIKKTLKNEKIINLLPSTFEKISKYMKGWVFYTLNKNNFLKRKLNVGILGLAYKANTNSTKNSVALEVIKKISNPINIFDPKVRLKTLPRNCTQLKQIEKIYQNCKVIILMTPWPEFKAIEKKISFLKKKGIAVIDPYRLLNSKIFFKNKVKYFTIGKNDY